MPQEPGTGSAPLTPGTPGSLPPPNTMSLEVVEVVDLGPSLRQIRLGGDDLVGFRFAPGQDLMLRLPLPGGELVSRRYTVRRADPTAGLADLNVVMHGDGPAAVWAAAARPGEELAEVVGPRGKITIDPDADWHFFLGDDTYIPGVLAMLEALPPGSRAEAVLEVSTPADGQELLGSAGREVQWLFRGDPPAGEAERLLDGSRAFQIPGGRGHAYIAAEVRVALALRDDLVARGMPRDQISAKGYWSRGRANAPRGEPDDPT